MDKVERSVERLIEKARKTNSARDAGERAAGFGAPDGSDAFQTLRTAMSAIHCGLMLREQGRPQNEWIDCITEGYAMIEVATNSRLEAD